MPKITSVEDLRTLKEAALSKINARIQGEEIDRLVQIYVGMDESGIAAGAKEIFHEFFHSAANKPIVVMQSAKIEDFAEPAVKVVKPLDKTATVFEKVTKEKVNQIISEFIEQGKSIDGMNDVKFE